jgi:hypothetical protein
VPVRERERNRPNSSARGYGHEHRKRRKLWEPRVERGEVCCWRCGKWIAPGEDWDLGHDDYDRSVWRGPECYLCNRATNGRGKNRRRVQPLRSKVW